MGLFDIFKSKEQRDADGAVGKILEAIFPGGEQDILRDMDRVHRLTKGKIPTDKLLGYVRGCKVLVHISQNHTEPTFIQSMKVRSENRITDAEAKDVYAYFAGEAAYLDNLTRMMPGSANAADVQRSFASGTYNDTIEGGRGGFGTEVNNPIPTICIRSSGEYLARLRYKGAPVESQRVGSTSSPVCQGGIDIYKISVGGRDVGTIYLSPYHKNTSKKAPAGFELA